jgi:hypothetical protein
MPPNRDKVSPTTDGISIQKYYNHPFSSLGKVDQRLYNLLYRKSKLESVNETSALLSGFAIVSDFV